MLTIGLRLTEVVMTNDLTFGLPLSRLGIAQASLALLSLLHRLSMQTSVKRKIPHAESPSSVRFRLYHPQKKEFLINSWEFMIISVEEKKSE